MIFYNIIFINCENNYSQNLKKLIRTSTVAMSLDILLNGQLNFLNQYFEILAVSGEDSHLETVRKREAVRTISVTMQRQISPIKDLKSLIQLYFVFKKEKPLIVHSITPKAGLLTMCAAYFAGVPIRIHTFTGLIFPTKKGIVKHIILNMDRILCKFSTNIYSEGQGIKNDLINYKITKKPLKIIANGNVNGIDTEYFNKNHFSEQHNLDLKQNLNINSNNFVFIFVGRIVSDKGINELISAFSKINSENKSTKLLLVGPFEDDLDPISIEAKNEIKNNKSIISVGYQNDVRPYFAISSCLVFPSYREGFPNVVLQAGAMELPSIVTNINGCNEIIQNQENGLVIAVKNKKAIYEAMKLLIKNKDLYQILKQNSRKKITNNYEQKIVWNAILDEYKKLENNV